MKLIGFILLLVSSNFFWYFYGYNQGLDWAIKNLRPVEDDYEPD